jgi:hypothetical protein
MRTMTKLLALMPLVVLGAACNGSSPGAPDNPIAADEGFATAPNASATSKAADADSCRNIIGVNLEIVPSTKAGVEVHATYVQFGGITVRCKAPIWSSDPRGALVTNQLNAFRVSVKPIRPVTVTAMAPNGVTGSLTLQGRATDLSASAVCKNVMGVKLALLPATNTPKPQIRATYLTLGPSMDVCPAPVWSSEPRGALTATKDPFVVGVSSTRPLTVTATAPNGVRGSFTLQGKDASVVCNSVKGVQLRIVPSPTPGPIVIEAAYVQFGPSIDNCPAPAWASDPRGILTGTKNPFRMRVSGATRPATVTATAPNGITGQITLQK